MQPSWVLQRVPRPSCRIQDPTGIITGVSCWVEHLFGSSMFMSYFGLHMFVSFHQPCLHSLHTVLFSRQQMQLHGVNKRKSPTNKIMLSHKNSLRPYLLHDVACLVIIHSSPIVPYQVSSSGFPATRWMDELSPGTVRQHCDERCKFVPPLGCRLVQRLHGADPSNLCTGSTQLEVCKKSVTSYLLFYQSALAVGFFSSEITKPWGHQCTHGQICNWC